MKPTQTILDPSKYTTRDLVALMSDCTVTIAERALNKTPEPTKISVPLTFNKPKTENEKRAELISFAKKLLDVPKVERSADGPAYKCYVFKGWRCNAEFFINREKRTVVAVLRGKYTGDIYSRGVAKCDPNDVYNTHIGKAIALYRALHLPVPTGLLESVQPTIAEVGDIVYYGEYDKNYLIVKSGESTAYERDATLRKAQFGSVISNKGKLIDDTKE